MSNQTDNKISDNAPSLLKVLLSDFFVSHWFISLLGFSIVASAMLLAYTSHETRKLTAQWQNLRQQNEAEQVTLASYRLEITSLSEANRISNLAKKELGMIKVNSHNEKVISL